MCSNSFFFTRLFIYFLLFNITAFCTSFVAYCYGPKTPFSACSVSVQIFFQLFFSHLLSFTSLVILLHLHPTFFISVLLTAKNVFNTISLHSWLGPNKSEHNERVYNERLYQEYLWLEKVFHFNRTSKFLFEEKFQC